MLDQMARNLGRLFSVSHVLRTTIYRSPENRIAIAAKARWPRTR